MRKTGMPIATRNMRIGLLGGSFNPAHKGHVHISVEALKRLKLDEVWWLISPQNPLKSKTETESLKKRLKRARNIISHPDIRATKLEARFGTRYTIDTLREIKKRYPNANFVWLMGADNLAHFDRWKKWKDIFKTMPIAVLDRPDYGIKVLNSKPATTFKQCRIDASDAPLLPTSQPPRWSYIPVRLDFTSSTQIRAQKNNEKKPRKKS